MYKHGRVRVYARVHIYIYIFIQLAIWTFTGSSMFAEIQKGSFKFVAQTLSSSIALRLRSILSIKQIVTRSRFISLRA